MKTRISIKVQTRRTGMPVFFILGALLLVAVACTPGSNTTPSTGAQVTSVPSAVVPATTVPPAGVPTSARDVASMNACAFFPEAAVATALSATRTDPNNPGSTLGGPQCTYYLTPSGGSTGQLYILTLLPADLFQLSLTGGLTNPQPVAGLGDQAFIGTRVGTTSINLLVLKSGDLAVEVVGDDAGMAQKLAAYVLANLP